MLETIINECKKREEALIDLRRELHKVPEIGGSLPKTRKIVCDFLDKCGISYTLNPNDDGLIAEIKGREGGKTVAFRADMDGLHIDEQTNRTFTSEIDGQMHGCGHDAHTAMLLIAAEILSERRGELNGTVRLLFQSGEETGSGALEMLNLGAIDGVDAVCALHVGNLAGDGHKPGDMIVLPGPVSAGKNKFSITVLGKGGHSAFPGKAIDPIIVGAEIVKVCRHMMETEYKNSAAVLTFGSFNAGIDHNTIPEKAILKGSIRVQDQAIRDELSERIVEIAESAARGYGAVCSVDLKKGSKTVVNDVELADFVAELCKDMFGAESVKTELSSPLMGSDDFANYASRIPSVYFFMHTNNEEKGITATNHNPGFDVDEAVLWKGAAAYVAIAKSFLE